MTKKYIFILLLFVLTACSTTKKPIVKKHPKEFVNKIQTVVKKPKVKIKKKPQNEQKTKIGRYLTYKEVTPKSLLDEVIQVRIPSEMKTIGSALRWVLINTGYELAKPTEFSLKARELLNKRLPARDRSIGPITVRDCVKQVIGPAYVLQADAINRIIKFDVKR